MERRVDEISSNVVRRDLLDYVTISGAGEPGIPQHSAFAWYPLDAPLPALCVSTLTPLGCALFYKVGRCLERLVPLVHKPPPFPSLDEEIVERGLISRLMVDMDLMANGIVSRGMAHVDAKIILEILIDRIVRSLLVFQKETRLSWYHCLLCQNQPVHAPRVCKRSFLLTVAIMPYGPYGDAVGDKSNGARVSILPPMRDFDPPTYVALLFNLAGITASRSRSFSYSFQFPFSSVVWDVEIELGDSPGYVNSTRISSQTYCTES